MRIARGTRHLPSFRGLSPLLRLYRTLFRQDTSYRIADFDGDLLLDANIRECVGINLWHAPEQYERDERRLFCSAIRTGSVVLDIGANIGIFTLLAAKRGAQVFAIECDPRTVAVLRKHIAINGFTDKVTTFELAAVESPKLLRLYQNESNRGGNSLYGSGTAVWVPGKTVDSLNLPPIDICKIDVEGAEATALRGMTETIKRSPNLKLLVEYSEPHGKARAVELLHLLSSIFSRISLMNGTLLGSESPPPYCNLWCSGVR
jgi:FkbM family methyltransferase